MKKTCFRLTIIILGMSAFAMSSFGQTERFVDIGGIYNSND